MHMEHVHISGLLNAGSRAYYDMRLAVVLLSDVVDYAWLWRISDVSVDVHRARELCMRQSCTVFMLITIVSNCICARTGPGKDCGECCIV